MGDTSDCGLATVLFRNTEIIIATIEYGPGDEWEVGFIRNRAGQAPPRPTPYLLGEIRTLQNDGALGVFDWRGDLAATIDPDTGIVTAEDEDCRDSAPILIKEVSPNSQVVMSGDDVIAVIEGRLPKSALKE